MFSFPLTQGNNMSPHYFSTLLNTLTTRFFRDEYQESSGNHSHIHALVGLSLHSVVDHVSKSVLGSPVLIYIDNCCGHKIVDASFDVIEEQWPDGGYIEGNLKNDNFEREGKQEWSDGELYEDDWAMHSKLNRSFDCGRDLLWLDSAATVTK